jgi:hypothetical protein
LSRSIISKWAIFELPSGSRGHDIAEASLFQGGDILTVLFLATPLGYSGIADVAEELLQQMLDENLRRSEFHRCGFTISIFPHWSWQ